MESVRKCLLGLLVLLLGCAPRSTSLPPLVLYNGGMEQGVDYPTCWGEPWVGSKRHLIHRDTHVKHGGSAALAVRVTPSDGVRSVGQELRVPGPRLLQLRGWVKVKGAVVVEVAVRGFRNGWEVLPYTPALRLEKEQDWTEVSQTVRIPQEAQRLEVGVVVKGSGQVWLDDVQLDGDGVHQAAAPPEWVAPPDHQKPTLPFPGFYWDNPTAWRFNHREQKRTLSQTPPEVLLVGDSITSEWVSWGEKDWNRYFKPLHSAVMAIGGDRTSQVLWRLRDGTLDGLHPKVVVLAIGINNLLHDTTPEADVVEGILACRAALRRTCPQAKVLVVGLFPAKEHPTDPLRARIKRVNALLKQHLPDLLDFGGAFLMSDGTLSRPISPDAVHLSPEGYTLYRQYLYPKVLESLKGSPR